MSELPECPAPGWDEAAVVRLADPAGNALAWIAPETGANCIAFAVKRAGAWVNLLFSGGPEALRSRPTRFGIPLLAPFPGLLPGGCYAWRGAEFRLPPNAADGQTFAHGFAHDRPWRITRRTASDLELALSFPEALSAAERAGYPFDVDLQARFGLDGGSLRVEFAAINRGREPAPLGLGLHPYAAVAALTEHRESLVVAFPPPAAAVSLPPLGKSHLEICPGAGGPSIAWLRSAHGGPALELRVAAGATALAIFVPADQPSVSFEPTTCALSAMAQGEGGPNGMPALGPGERLALSAALRLDGTPPPPTN